MTWGNLTHTHTHVVFCWFFFSLTKLRDFKQYHSGGIFLPLSLTSTKSKFNCLPLSVSLLGFHEIFHLIKSYTSQGKGLKNYWYGSTTNLLNWFAISTVHRNIRSKIDMPRVLIKERKANHLLSSSFLKCKNDPCREIQTSQTLFLRSINFLCLILRLDPLGQLISTSSNVWHTRKSKGLLIL